MERRSRLRAPRLCFPLAPTSHVCRFRFRLASLLAAADDVRQILARYASAGAVYRELIQNSNDAEATVAEIRIATSAAAAASSRDADGDGKQGKGEAAARVHQVTYRNNGLPFREQDWARLRKIAEGNP